MEENSRFEIGDLSLFTFFMPHSIPQCFSVGLEAKTQDGTKRVYFSSDFKMNGAEVRHKVAHLKKFAPVDYLFVDSTGSLQEGETVDERREAATKSKMDVLAAKATADDIDPETGEIKDRRGAGTTLVASRRPPRPTSRMTTSKFWRARWRRAAASRTRWSLISARRLRPRAARRR